jgi:hexosaminidase
MLRALRRQAKSPYIFISERGAPFTVSGLAKLIEGNPLLEAALPISADIAALAGIGLDAIAAVESGRGPSADWRGRAKELLDRQAAAAKASESIVEVITMQQPPADLLISVTPGIRKLTEAAVNRTP